MKGFRALVVLGVLLVTLLVVIDYIDAAQKGSKLKDNKKNNLKQKSPKLDGVKLEKSKKSNVYRSASFGEDVKNLKENSKVETKKIKVKKGTTYTTNDRKTLEGSKPKITKTYQKVKKYKIVEDEPSQKFTSSITSKAKNVKTSQKKMQKEKDNIQDVIDELNKMYNEDSIILNEENVLNNQKKKKYRLVDVTVQEEEEEEEAVEDNEERETLIEEDPEEEELSSTQRTESAEVIGKFKTTTVKLPKSKKSLRKNPEPVEEDLYEDPTNEEYFYNNTEDNSETGYREDSNPHPATRYEDPNPQPSCRSLPEDPNRQGPKKLTHYIIEEEVDGKIKKRVVSEEDGVTMCEVADLLKAQYNEYLNENSEE